VSARSRGPAALALVLFASLSVQLSAVLAHTLFDRLGPAGVSGLRFACAAVIALAIVRPRLRGRSRGEWLGIALFGLSIAGMNAFLYLALDRLPLGVALTLEFLGPFAVAVVGIRRPRAALFPVLGFLGVVLIVRPTGDIDPWGVALGILAGASLAAYTVLAERVGRVSRGFDGLALALVIAAVVTAPFGLAAMPLVRPLDLPVIAASATLGVAVAFAADYLAVRMTSARTVAVLLSFDPVLAALLGAGLLGQLLDPVTIAGIALVAVAGGFSAALAGRRAPHALARRRRSSWRPAAMAGIAPVRFPRARTTV
jgi:inner membrane transporter RhtA